MSRHKNDGPSPCEEFELLQAVDLAGAGPWGEPSDFGPIFRVRPGKEWWDFRWDEELGYYVPPDVDGRLFKPGRFVIAGLIGMLVAAFTALLHLGITKRD